MSRTLLWIVLIGAVCLEPGCLSEGVRKRARLKFEPQHAVTNWTRSPRFEQLGIRRVAVLPFVNRSRCSEASTLVTGAFAIELRKTKKFDVLACSVEMPLSRLAASRSSFDAVEARLLGETLNVDGVILGEILEYEPYRPLALALRVLMIDTRTGRVVWTVDETLDTSELAVANLARQYYFDVVDPRASQFRDERVLMSMRTFARCVSYHFVRTLDRPLTTASGLSRSASGDP